MSTCTGCAGSGKYVATQNMAGFARVPDTIVAALLASAPMPAIVDCPVCDGDGAVRSCRKCGCTEDDCSGCIERTGHSCYWVAADLCSACA